MINHIQFKQSFFDCLSHETIGILRINLDGTILFGNKAACYFLNEEDATIHGKNYWELINEAKPTELPASNSLLIVKENILLNTSLTHCIEKFENSLVVCIYQPNNIANFESTYLNDSLIIVDTIDLGIVYQDNSGKINYANRAAQKILGLSFGQLTGRDSMHPDWKAIHPNGTNFPGHEHPAMISLQTGKPVTNEIMGVFHPEIHNYVWILVSAYPILNPVSQAIEGVFASFKDITHQFLSQKELEYQNKVSEILVETTTQFVNLDLNKLDAAINEMLAKLGAFLEVDRFYIFDYDFENGFANNTYEWCANGIEPQIDNLQNFPLEYIGNWIDLNKVGKSFIIPNVDNLPDDDNFKSVLVDQQIKSMCCVPIMLKNQCLGMVGYDAVKTIHNFNETETKLLSVIAELLAGVHERKSNSILINETLKELNGVYTVSQLNVELQIKAQDYLNRTCVIIKDSFRFPEKTHVAINYLNEKYTTKNFKETKKSLKQSLIIDNTLQLGKIAVFIEDDAFFMNSEPEFLNTIGRLITQKYTKDLFEETLQASEEKFKIIADNNYNWEFWTAPDGSFIYHSPSCVNVSGYTVEEIMKTPSLLQSAVHPKDLVAFKKHEEIVYKTKKDHKITFRAKTKEGEIKHIEQVCHPVYSKTGAYLGIRGTNVDITEKVFAFNELSKNEQRLNNLLNSQTSFVLRTNLRGIHTYWNKAFEDTFGWLYEAHGLSEGDSLSSICEHDRAKAQETVYKCFKEPGKIFKVQLEKPAKNGSTIITLWDFVCITDDKGNPFEIQCIGVDITDSVRSFQKLQESERWLESLLKSQTSFVLRTNMYGQHTYWNHAFEETFGWIYESGLDHGDSLKSICEYHHPRTLEAVQACIAEPGKIVKVELDKPAKNNEIRTTLWEFVCLTDANGYPNEMQCMGIDITERRQAEKKMAESEAKYKLLFNVSPDPIIIFNLDGSIIEFNEALNKLLHLPEVDFKGKTILDFSPPNQKNNQLSKEFHQLAIEKSDPNGNATFEWILLNNLNKNVYTIVSCVLIEYNNQKAIYTSWKDISAIKQAQEEVFRFKTIMDQASYGSAINDLDGHFLWLNKAFANMHGYEPEELIGKELSIFHNEKQLPEVMRLVNEIKEKGGFNNEEVGHVRKDGSEFPTLMSAKLIVNDDKKPQFLSATCIDISDKVERETVIKEQNKKLNAIIDALPDMIFVNNIDGKYLDFYRSLNALSTKDYSYLVGKNIKDVFTEEITKIHYEKISECLQTNNMIAYEYPLEEDGGQKYYEARIVKIDEETVLRFVRNITDRKRSEQLIIDLNQNLEKKVQERTLELKSTNEALEIAKKEADKANEAKSVFLSRMSHELRTPMNAILGFAQILEMTPLNDKQKKGVSHILKSGNHLLNLINEVLDIARIESGRISLSVEPVYLNSLIKEVIELIVPVAASRNIGLHFAPPHNFYIMADKQRLKQIIINVINNAIKYNHVGGSVWVNLLENKEFITISITDNGFGINKSDIEKIFTPFERIGAEKHQIEGTGLGLSVVKQLTQSMSGKLGVESEVGKGSTFWFEFIKADLKHIANPSLEEFNNTDNNKSTITSETIFSADKSILYIEDNFSNIELIESILQTTHHDIKLITNTYGGNAVSLALQHKPKLILLDLHLPDMHGSEVLDKLLLNETTKQIPVVIVSADAMQKQIDYMLNLGAKTYLTKPIQINELLNIIDNYIQ